MTELLGNDALRARLQTAARRGTLSHCYLLCGPRGSGKKTLARYLAALWQCESEEKPCMHCRACRKVAADIHPDVITVDEPGKRTISVDRIRALVSDVFIRPNEGRRKVYLLPRAQDITPPGQNALLKILEEPPAYAAFALLTEQPDGVLATVRSRCVELTLAPLPRQLLCEQLRLRHPEADSQTLEAAAIASGGFLGQALALLDDAAMPPACTAFSRALGDELALIELFAGLEKQKREQLLPLLARWQQLLAEALKVQAGLPALSPEARTLAAQSGPALAGAIAALRRATDYLNANVGVPLVCGMLAVQLRAPSGAR